jgi:disulfide bond formation protein DsbB
MNYWLDRGGFLLVLYTLIYVTSFGAAPQWIGLYSGAFAILAVGIGIEIYKKVKSNG